MMHISNSPPVPQGLYPQARDGPAAAWGQDSGSITPSACVTIKKSIYEPHLEQPERKDTVALPTKGKNIFDQMLNAVTDRDEKAALEEYKKHVLELEQKVVEAEQRAAANAKRAEVAEKKVAELQAAQSKSQADLQTQLSRAQADLNAAKASVTLLQQRVNAAEARVKAFEDEKLHTQQQAAAVQAAAAQILATHTLTKEETLSHLSLKYYGHATEPYWRIIYEANKDVVGPNPNKVHAGMVLKIPVLPDSMK